MCGGGGGREGRNEGRNVGNGVGHVWWHTTVLCRHVPRPPSDAPARPPAITAQEDCWVQPWPYLQPWPYTLHQYTTHPTHTPHQSEAFWQSEAVLSLKRSSLAEQSRAEQAQTCYLNSSHATHSLIGFHTQLHSPHCDRQSSITYLAKHFPNQTQPESTYGNNNIVQWSALAPCQHQNCCSRPDYNTAQLPQCVHMHHTYKMVTPEAKSQCCGNPTLQPMQQAMKCMPTERPLSTYI